MMSNWTRPSMEISLDSRVPNALLEKVVSFIRVSLRIVRPGTVVVMVMVMDGDGDGDGDDGGDGGCT